MYFRALGILLCAVCLTPVLSSGADFTNLHSAAVPPYRQKHCLSSPNPDAPAYRAFMAGNPAGAGLAAVAWPLHVRVGVVRVQFQPDDNPATTGNGTWGDIPFFTFSDSSSGVVIQDPTVDSRSKAYIQRNLLFVSEYYEAVSQGKVLFSAPDSLTDISAIYTLPQEMAEYGKNDDYSLRTSNLAVEAIKAADAEMDYSKYDVVLIFHAGCGEHTDYDGKSPDDIYPVEINGALLREILAEGDPSYQGIATNDRNPDGTAFYVSELEIFPETAIQDYDLPPDQNGVKPNPQGPLQGLLGVMVHELGHYFGLPDLYDTQVGTRPTVGFFALMATGYYNSVSRIPSHPCAWSKVYLGWIDPVVVTGDWANIVLRATELWGGGTQVIKVPISSTEYFLLENRLRDTNFNGKFDFNETGGNFFPDIMTDDYRLPDGSFAEFDWSIPNVLADNDTTLAKVPGAPEQLGSGVLIWHIDEEVIRRNFNSDLTLNSVNTVPQHLGVALEEADGIPHMLEAFPATLDPGYGSPFDVFGGGVPGAKSLELGNLNLLFGPYSNPNSTSYTGLPSNIEISGFRSVSVAPGEPLVDSLLALDIRFNSVAQGAHLPHPLSGWPRIIGTGTNGSSPLVIDLDSGAPGSDVVQATDDGRVYVADSRGALTLIAATGDSISGSPAAGDITGDSDPEVVVAGTNGSVYAFTLEGAASFSLPGFPVHLAGRIGASPVLADVDGDGVLDILIGNRVQHTGSQLYALTGSGRPVSGFPVEVDDEIAAAVAVLHGVSGQAVGIYAGTIAGSLYAFNSQGGQIFRRDLGAPILCAPAAGRLGLPGENESFRICAFTADGNIWSFDSLGALQPGWPVRTGGSCLAGGAIGDVDGDGLNELIVPVDFPDTTAPGRHRLYVLDYNGASPAGFPLSLQAAQTFSERRYLSAPSLADLDGDGKQDIIVATRGRLAVAFSGAEAAPPVARFILGSNSLACPVPADLDGDGRLDLLCADGEGYLYAYSTGSPDLSPQWAGLGAGPRRTGLSLRVQTAPGLSATGEVLPDRLCYVYPNPVRGGGQAHLAYTLGKKDVQRVTVDILTTSGEAVESLAGGTAAADGLTNEVTWDVDRYASGVYLILVQAYSSSGGTARVIRKMAVIK